VLTDRSRRPQDHTSVQTALLSSLPDGTRVIYMSPQSSPVFQARTHAHTHTRAHITHTHTRAHIP
jgi:hypothetical protein